MPSYTKTGENWLHSRSNLFWHSVLLPEAKSTFWCECGRVNTTERAHSTAEDYKPYAFTMIFVPLVQKSLMKIDIDYDSRPSHLINFVFMSFVYKYIGHSKPNH